jgi:hypothetical protein
MSNKMDARGGPPPEKREPSWLDEISFSTKVVLVVTVVAIGGSFLLWLIGLFV